jgi:BTB/POZ domain
MSTTSFLEPASNAQKSYEPLLFDYPDADIILRSCDARHFRVPKSCIATSSPVLDKLIQKALDSPAGARGEASLPVVKLPESGEILHNLLTFVFPSKKPPPVPSSTKKSMELLSVAQRYQMASTLDHIRGSVMRQKPPPTQRAALCTYSLAQHYGLRQEALLAAQDILKYPMKIEDMVDFMHGASLYELWKYYKNFRAILKLDLTKFKTSGARAFWRHLQCGESSSFPIPRWLDDYIESIGDAPHLFDIFEFNIALVSHISGSRNQRCMCRLVSSRDIRNFWEALESVIHSSFQKVSVTNATRAAYSIEVVSRLSQVYLSCWSGKPESIRPYLCLYRWSYPYATRILSSDRTTASTSESISQYWLSSRLSSKLYISPSGLPTVNQSKGFPWSNFPKAQSC